MKPLKPWKIYAIVTGALWFCSVPVAGFIVTRGFEGGSDAEFWSLSALWLGILMVASLIMAAPITYFQVRSLRK